MSAGLNIFLVIQSFCVSRALCGKTLFVTALSAAVTWLAVILFTTTPSSSDLASCNAVSKETPLSPFTTARTVEARSVPPVIEFWVQISSRSLSRSIHSWGVPSSNFLTYFLYFVESAGCPTRVFNSNTTNIPLSSSTAASLIGTNGSTGESAPPALTLGITDLDRNISSSFRIRTLMDLTSVARNWMFLYSLSSSKCYKFIMHYANCTFCKSDVLEKRVSLV